MIKAPVDLVDALPTLWIALEAVVENKPVGRSCLRKGLIKGFLRTIMVSSQTQNSKRNLLFTSISSLIWFFTFCIVRFASCTARSTSLIIFELSLASTALFPKLVQAAVTPSAVPTPSKGTAAPPVMSVAIVRTPPRILNTCSKSRHSLAVTPHLVKIVSELSKTLHSFFQPNRHYPDIFS